MSPLIDPDTGEILQPTRIDPASLKTPDQLLAAIETLQAAVEREQAALAQAQDTVRGLQRDIRGWTTRYANAIRNRQQEAETQADWPIAKRLFEYWREQCKHPRSRWTLDRYETVQPFVGQYGAADCCRAIAGAAFDPFITVARNGASLRHDSWELVFRNAGKVEQFANRAPRNFKAPEWARKP